MKYKYSLLGLAAGTALLVATGCSKQEPVAKAPADNTKPQPSAAAAQPQAVETPKQAKKQPATRADKQPAVAAKPDAAVATTPAPTAPAPATSSPAPVVTAVTNTAASPAATNAAAVPAVTNGTVASAVQTAIQTQQVSFAQSATNQVQALAAAATNQVLSALGMTNQAASTATNQVQALLENAKNLSANQKYQDALSNLTQLYATKLTPEQQQKADDLKAQIETQVQSNVVQKASSVLGNFFGGKK